MSLPTDIPKEYLGDGLYVAYDGYQLILTTNIESPDTANTVYLESSVYRNLLGFVERLNEKGKV